MSSNIHHLDGFSIVDGDIRVELSLERINNNLNKAQFDLDNDVMNSMKSYMPINTGNFIQRTQAENVSLAGSGQVVAGASPFGRFLYMGKVMVGERTGSPWAQEGEKKVVTDQNLNLTRGNPQATPLWFDTAKQADGEKWIAKVKKTVGG